MDIPVKEAVGARLKECRLSHGMTQQQVADQLQVAQPVYQRFEKGLFECSYEQLIRLCDIFDISADDLLGRNSF